MYEFSFPLQGTINWTASDLSQLFSAIFYTSLITNLIGGVLSDQYGPKVFLITGLVIAVFSTSLLPFAALHLPYWYTLALRLVFGVGLVSVRCKRYKL